MGSIGKKFRVSLVSIYVWVEKMKNLSMNTGSRLVIKPKKLGFNDCCSKDNLSVHFYELCTMLNQRESIKAVVSFSK